MVEPAYSLIYDHRNLKNLISEVETENVLSVISNYLEHPLNSSQEHVFTYSFENRVTLLWGPPGTGKTTTLAAIVLGWVEYSVKVNQSVTIALGSSNWTAIDNLLKEIWYLIEQRVTKLGEFPKTVRISRVRSSSGEEFTHGKIEDIVVNTQRAENLKTELDSRTVINIVGTTWKQMYNLSKPSRRDPAQPKKWFDVLLIDEASQVKVEHAASYFLYLRENFQLILAGDDKQLGPIHGFKMEESSDGLFDCIYTFMKDTHRIPPQAIVDNYRSNIDINKWPNTRFYDEKLVSKMPDNRLAIKFTDRKPDDWPKSLIWNDEYIKILDPSKPITIITYPSSVFTISNPFEAQIVSGLCCMYKLSLNGLVGEEEFKEKRIGIVTPHRAQRSLIQNLLLNASVGINDNSFIDTVDRFQGQERDLILSSYSVSDKDFVNSEDEFILDPRRFNVSLTRAKKKFIMIISEALIDYLPNDKNIAEGASHLQMFVTKYCKDENTVSLNYYDQDVVRGIVCKIKNSQL